MQPNVLEERLIDFAVRIIRLSANLPKVPAGKHLAGQILRCGTAPAPNYAEARGEESKADFIHKLGLALKELNETQVWLQMIHRTQWVSPSMLKDLIDEKQQLCRIFVAQIKTAKSNQSAARK